MFYSDTVIYKTYPVSFYLNPVSSITIFLYYSFIFLILSHYPNCSRILLHYIFSLLYSKVSIKLGG